MWRYRSVSRTRYRALMSLRWGVGLPGPFFVTGRFPTGRGLFGLFASFVYLSFMLMYWAIVATVWPVIALVGLVMWTINSIRARRLTSWPVHVRPRATRTIAHKR
jgi:hypothetical protein